MLVWLLTKLVLICRKVCHSETSGAAGGNSDWVLFEADEQYGGLYDYLLQLNPFGNNSRIGCIPTNIEDIWRKEDDDSAQDVRSGSRFYYLLISTN